MTMALKIVIICENFQWQQRLPKHYYCDENDRDSNSISIFHFCSSQYIPISSIEICFLISSSQVVIMSLFLYHIFSRWYRPVMCLLKHSTLLCALETSISYHNLTTCLPTIPFFIQSQTVFQYLFPTTRIFLDHVHSCSKVMGFFLQCQKVVVKFNV